MKLSELLQGIGTIAVQGSVDITIQSITTDSRQVKEGTLFIAVRGTRQDGHTFIEKAVQAG
jgi:UDP-N-acetylmuramoyl-L-alanyl-D-glutamate--2,6-diaminopimelate ligase